MWLPAVVPKSASGPLRCWRDPCVAHVPEAGFWGVIARKSRFDLLAEPLVSDRVAVQHKKRNAQIAAEVAASSPPALPAWEARRLRSADRTHRRISTPASPPQREFCLALAFSPAGETLSSRLWPWRRLCVCVDHVASSRCSFGRPLRTKGNSRVGYFRFAPPSDKELPVH